ncbi:putative nickel-responsive regulator [Bradyrhizobium japonicum]|nr:nickel responsive regulator [Bradyrhizobium japonicum USDA 6]GEC45053.1 putative nickel-responsive regulator [Bradyrhizobium japonicum]
MESPPHPEFKLRLNSDLSPQAGRGSKSGARGEDLMQRITITIEDDLLAEIDAAAEARGYQNRSEIIRDLARAGLQQSTEDTAQTGPCVAGLVYVYDHAARDLSKRLVQEFHGHHDLALATLHVHLDDNNCMEMTALRGDAGEVRHFADHIIAERGVRYGRVVMIPTGEGKQAKVRKHGHRHE